MPSSKDIIVKKFSSHEVKEKIQDLARLRIKIFKDYPYLYDGDLDYEKKYLQVYLDSPTAAIIVALHGEKVVGASTCMALSENKYIQQPFLNEGYSLNELFYFGESLLYKEYRGLGVGNKFFSEREAHALSYPEVKYTTFCAVQRPLNHPLLPHNYIPHDEFWKKRGYIKHTELMSHFDWLDINEKAETSKPMVYWLKKHR